MKNLREGPLVSVHGYGRSTPFPYNKQALHWENIVSRDHRVTRGGMEAGG